MFPSCSSCKLSLFKLAETAYSAKDRNVSNYAEVIQASVHSALFLRISCVIIFYKNRRQSLESVLKCIEIFLFYAESRPCIV